MKIKCLIIIIMGLMLFACSNDGKTEKELTFMVYMAADNSLSDNVPLDISQMEMAEFDPELVNVIVQADLLYSAEDPGCRRWQILPDGTYDEVISSPVIESLGEIDSGDWRSLAAFYNWAVSEYPAENYILTIWSHGNDWYSYPATPNHFCPDHESSSWFDIPGKDLQQAFQHFNCKPDLVIMDACHMQSLEVIMEIADYADRVCGSTDIVPELGFPYNDVISGFCHDLPASFDYGNIARSFVDSYRPGGSQNLQGHLNQPVCLSTIETYTLSDSILPLIAEFVEYVFTDEPDRQLFLDARSQCYEFNDLEINIDLFQFIMFLMEEDINEELSDICSRLEQQMFTDRDYYNYPSYYLGNILVTFPEEEEIVHWSNLRDQYSLLDFDLLTGWSNFINWLFESDLDYS